MFLTKQELEKKPYAERITRLRKFCEEQKHTSIPRLLDEAAAFGGIRADVLDFFETNRDLDVNKDMFMAYLCFLTGGESADAKWYEIIKELNSQKDEAVRRRFFGEVTEAFRAGIPCEIVCHALECDTVYEFQCYHREYLKRTGGDAKELSEKEWKGLELLVASLSQMEEDVAAYGELSMVQQFNPSQEELERKIFELENDVRYYKKLYNELHFEMDRTAMALMQERKENRRLKQEMGKNIHISDSQGTPIVNCLDNSGNRSAEANTEEKDKIIPEDVVEYAAYDDVGLPGMEMENKSRAEDDFNVYYPEDGIDPEDMFLDEDDYSEELSDMLAESREEPGDMLAASTEELNDTVAESWEELGDMLAVSTEELSDTVAESRMQKRESMPANINTEKKRNPIMLFVEIVQKVKCKRFLKKKESDKRRELVSLMNRNQYGSDQQKVILSAMNSQTVSMEAIWTMVYHGFTLEQLMEVLDVKTASDENVEKTMPATG